MKVRTLIPRPLREAVNRLFGATIVYHGPYADWKTARAQTGGYDAGSILQRVSNATQHALANPSLYEQDGSVLPGPAPESPVLLALMTAAAKDDGRLSVVDFGGGLGSHAMRWRNVLDVLSDWRWCVVEQPHFVAEGERLFGDILHLSFASSIAESKRLSPNVVMASSVLQYLSDPLDTLDRLVALDARTIIIDRTPFADDGVERILAQYVPASLGKASYPLRMFAREDFEARLCSRYKPVQEFNSRDEPIRIHGASAHYLGSIWERIA